MMRLATPAKLLQTTPHRTALCRQGHRVLSLLALETNREETFLCIKFPLYVTVDAPRHPNFQFLVQFVARFGIINGADPMHHTAVTPTFPPGVTPLSPGEKAHGNNSRFTERPTC